MEKKLILDVSKTKGFYDEALYNEVKKEVLAAQKELDIAMVGHTEWI